MRRSLYEPRGRVVHRDGRKGRVLFTYTGGWAGPTKHQVVVRWRDGSRLSHDYREITDAWPPFLRGMRRMLGLTNA